MKTWRDILAEKLDRLIDISTPEGIDRTPVNWWNNNDKLAEPPTPEMFKEFWEDMDKMKKRKKGDNR